MSYYSYISLLKGLSDDLEHAGILDSQLYVSLFQEIRGIREDIQQDKKFIRNKDVSISEKYKKVQHHNALLVNYLTKLLNGLDSTADQPGSLLAPIGEVILRMNSMLPKYIDSENAFGKNDLLGVANGTSKTYMLMSQMAFFITDLIDGIHFSTGYVSVLLNDTLIALSELQGMNNEVMMQVFEELQATKEKLKSTEEQLRDTKEQLNKMHEDLEYIKDQLGLSKGGSKQQSMVDFYISGP
ncbi:MAG TPA: hypothetical protein ENO30_04665 [Thermodesulfobium narugense]|nr:hypothetical protein [Thermodesulfobium narugense]